MAGIADGDQDTLGAELADDTGRDQETPGDVVAAVAYEDQVTGGRASS